MMKRNFLSKLFQASLMCCLAVILTGCDELFDAIDNPIQTSISMATSDVKLAVGQTNQRKATTASPATVVYASADPAIATVDGNGVVTGVASGTTTITASVAAVDGWTAASASYKVIVGDGSSSSATPNPGASTPTEMKNTPFTVEALEAGTKVEFYEVGDCAKNIEYSTDGGATWTAGSTASPGVSVPLANAGDKVMFRGDNSSYATLSAYNYVNSDKPVKVYGNIMSLIKKTGFETLTTLTDAYAFRKLFKDNDKLTDASGLLLPAETLTAWCYSDMFNQCVNLTAAPELPATTLADYCYYYMFRDCDALTTAPTLPATEMKESCYSGMFNSCNTLTTAPELPATTLADGCYNSMFMSCTSLTSVPDELPVTDLKSSCYGSMFFGCISLTTAPKLPATTLADYCYSNMFYGCTSLTEAWIKAEFNYSNCMMMFEGCTATGVLHGSLTHASSWNSNQPSNWTVQANY